MINGIELVEEAIKCANRYEASLDCPMLGEFRLWKSNPADDDMEEDCVKSVMFVNGKHVRNSQPAFVFSTKEDLALYLESNATFKGVIDFMAYSADGSKILLWTRPIFRVSKGTVRENADLEFAFDLTQYKHHNGVPTFNY